MKTPSNEAPLLGGSLVLTLGACTAAYLAHIILAGTLPGYTLFLGGDKAMAGLVVGLFSATALAARPLAGSLLDGPARRLVLAGGVALFLLGTLAQALLPGLGALLAFRVVQGIGFSAATTAAGVLVSDLVPPKRLPEGLGWLQISYALSFALGPALGLALARGPGYPSVFALDLGVAVLGLAAAAAVVSRLPEHKRHPHPAVKAAREADAEQRPFLGLGGLVVSVAAVSLFLQIAMGCVLAFAPIYGAQLGLGAGSAFFFPAYAGASILGIRVLGGWGVRRFGRDAVLFSCLLAAAAAMVLMAFASGLWTYLGAGALFGAGFGSSQTLIAAAMMGNCPPHRKGSSNALNFAAMDIAMTAGPIMAGVVAQRWGFFPVYLVAAGAVLVGLGLFVLFVKGRTK